MESGLSSPPRRGSPYQASLRGFVGLAHHQKNRTPSDGILMPEHSGFSIVTADMPRCVHHWLLGDPAQGVITGHCKHCGANRAFPATADGTDHLRDVRDLAVSLRTSLLRETA